MPRPATLDNNRKEIACALARAGMTGRWIAAFFGVDESTLRYALERDESFRLRFEQARALMFLDHLTHIANAASKSWRASAWLLERAFPDECDLRHRAPTDRPNGVPLAVPVADGFHGDLPDGVPNEAPMPPDEATHKPEAPDWKPEASAREDWKPESSARDFSASPDSSPTPEP